MVETVTNPRSRLTILPLVLISSFDRSLVLNVECVFYAFSSFVTRMHRFLRFVCYAAAIEDFPRRIGTMVAVRQHTKD